MFIVIILRSAAFNTYYVSGIYCHSSDAHRHTKRNTSTSLCCEMRRRGQHRKRSE